MLLGFPLLEVAGWVVFIATNQFCSRCRRRLAMGAPDSPVRHRTVSGVPPRHPVRQGWSWSTIGGFVLMRHRTVRCDTGQSSALRPTALTSAAITVLHCSCQSRPLRANSRCSAGAPDSPMPHRTLSGATPDTVRCYTGQSGEL
jgi:hypothetical protein